MTTVRPSSFPVFDSRDGDPPYTVSSFVNGRPVDFLRPIPDPFVNYRVTTVWGWRDRLRILFGRPTVVVVAVGASAPVIEAVLELDGNYRGAPGSARRMEADAEVDVALHRL